MNTAHAMTEKKPGTAKEAGRVAKTRAGRGYAFTREEGDNGKEIPAMSECRFHTNIINERNPRDHEPSYRHQIHRTGGGLSGPREFGKPDFSFDDGPRTTVTTGGQAPHRWHTELSMVRGERTLLDTRRIIDANHLA